MTDHPTANDEIRELAGLYAAGALPPDEEAAFKAHVRTCAVCAAEAQAFGEAVSWLPFAAADQAPPPHLREKLLARMQQPQPGAGIRVVRAGEGSWFNLGPGITAKRLYDEPASGNVVLLVRMEPGAQYPPHSHADVEHAFVLEGELHFGELVLRPGDYQCALPSSTHRSSHTVNGCMVLIVASQNNTMLPWNR